MIVLLMVMPFIIGYVDRTCQSFLSGCAFSPFSPFSFSVFDLIIVDFTFPCLWVISFFWLNAIGIC